MFRNFNGWVKAIGTIIVFGLDLNDFHRVRRYLNATFQIRLKKISIASDMPKQHPFNIEIDKLTRSIENAITGDKFPTQVLPLIEADIRKLKKNEWLFDWKTETKQADKTVYKLVITGNEDIIQGLVSLQDRGDHIFMPLIESNKFNRGAKKVYLGVPANLIAFACKLSFDCGYGGYVSFESKTKLIEHYKKSLGAQVLFGNIMAIDTRAAIKLIEQYFPLNP